MKSCFQVLFLLWLEYIFTMKIVRVILAVLIGVSIAVTALVGKDKIAEIRKDGEKTEYKGVITLWQIDSFEGGIGSRKQFLLEIARGFEKENQGVLIMVINHTQSSAEESLKNGRTPDMISYGLGVDITGQNELKISNDFVGGKVGDKTYATPWCKGGYALIANPKLASENYSGKGKVLVSQQEYSQPLLAAMQEGYQISDFEVLEPMKAYVNFTAGTAPYLLATQRDVVRLSRRGMEVNVYPLTEYNDLYQYISITSADGQKKYYSEKFVEYLTSEKSQMKLNKICMLSAFYDGISFSEQGLNEMQKVKAKKTLSAFTDKRLIKEWQTLAALAIKGNDGAKESLKSLPFLELD